MPSLRGYFLKRFFDFFDESLSRGREGGEGSKVTEGKKTSTNSPARPPERQRGVLLILDLEEHVEHHRAAAVFY